MLLLSSSVNSIIHVHIESVYFVYHELFCQKKTGDFLLNIICKQL